MKNLYGLVFDNDVKKLVVVNNENKLTHITPQPKEILPVKTVPKPDGEFISKWTWFDDYVQQEWVAGVPDNSDTNP